jgi:phage terminase small subunit
VGLNDRQRAFVGFYLGDARWNATKAAEMAGYRHPRMHGSRLLTNDDIRAEIQAWRDEARAGAIAQVEYRLSVLDDLERRYRDLIAARSGDLADEAPGGETGLLVRQYKAAGEELRAEYKADTAVTGEIRDLHKQAAHELGQWTEKLDLSGGIEIREYEGVPAGAP